MNGDNEYRKDGKLYLKKIKSCRVERTDGNIYILSCRVIQRGERLYYYVPGSGCITLDDCYSHHALSNGKTFYLSEDAEKTVNEAVSAADALLAAVNAPDGGFIRADFPEIELSLYYKPLKPFRYLPIYRLCGKLPFEFIFGAESDLDGMLRSLHFECRFSDAVNAYFHPNESNLETHPLYIAAKEAGDKVLVSEMDLSFGTASKEERELIAELSGLEVLPRAGAQLNTEFYIQREAIRIDILAVSGYKIIHRANFAMPGFTRTAVTVNPYGRFVIDSAPLNSSCVSWGEFTAAVYAGSAE